VLKAFFREAEGAARTGNVGGGYVDPYLHVGTIQVLADVLRR
jgi:hypothetical protein